MAKRNVADLLVEGMSQDCTQKNWRRARIEASVVEREVRGWPPLVCYRSLCIFCVELLRAEQVVGVIPVFP